MATIGSFARPGAPVTIVRGPIYTLHNLRLYTTVDAREREDVALISDIALNGQLQATCENHIRHREVYLGGYVSCSGVVICATLADLSMSSF